MQHSEPSLANDVILWSAIMNYCNISTQPWCFYIAANAVPHFALQYNT
jgi:hypothetical protein